MHNPGHLRLLEWNGYPRFYIAETTYAARRSSRFLARTRKLPLFTAAVGNARVFEATEEAGTCLCASVRKSCTNVHNAKRTDGI